MSKQKHNGVVCELSTANTQPATLDISKPAPGCKRCYVLTGTPADGAFLRTVVFGWEPIAVITPNNTTIPTLNKIANLPILESA